jgi:hypothetical protein
MFQRAGGTGLLDGKQPGEGAPYCNRAQRIAAVSTAARITRLCGFLHEISSLGCIPYSHVFYPGNDFAAAMSGATAFSILQARTAAMRHRLGFVATHARRAYCRFPLYTVALTDHRQS